MYSLSGQITWGYIFPYIMLEQRISLNVSDMTLNAMIYIESYPYDSIVFEAAVVWCDICWSLAFYLLCDIEDIPLTFLACFLIVKIEIAICIYQGYFSRLNEINDLKMSPTCRINKYLLGLSLILLKISSIVNDQDWELVFG